MRQGSTVWRFAELIVVDTSQHGSVGIGIDEETLDQLLLTSATAVLTVSPGIQEHELLAVQIDFWKMAIIEEPCFLQDVEYGGVVVDVQFPIGNVGSASDCRQEFADLDGLSKPSGALVVVHLRRVVGGLAEATAVEVVHRGTAIPRIAVRMRFGVGWWAVDGAVRWAVYVRLAGAGIGAGAQGK
jgi:hypothetical protein